MAVTLCIGTLKRDRTDHSFLKERLEVGVTPLFFQGRGKFQEGLTVDHLNMFLRQLRGTLEKITFRGVFRGVSKVSTNQSSDVTFELIMLTQLSIRPVL